MLSFDASTHATTPHADYFPARMADDRSACGASRAAGRGRARRDAASHAQARGRCRYARTESVFVRSVSGMVCRCGEKAPCAGRLQRQRPRRVLRRRAQGPERSRAFIHRGTPGFHRTPAPHERVPRPCAGHHRRTEPGEIALRTQPREPESDHAVFDRNFGRTPPAISLRRNARVGRRNRRLLPVSGPPLPLVRSQWPQPPPCR